MLRQTSVKMAVLLHKQTSDWFHALLTVSSIFSEFQQFCKITSFWNLSIENPNGAPDQVNGNVRFVWKAQKKQFE